MPSTVQNLARLMTDMDERSKTFSAWLRCQNCGACYYGETEEYWFDDDFVFSLYQAEADFWEASVAEALRCPQQNNPECNCTAHRNPAEKRGKLTRLTHTYYNDSK
jgi:hypothetical protein